MSYSFIVGGNGGGIVHQIRADKTLCGRPVVPQWQVEIIIPEGSKPTIADIQAAVDRVTCGNCRKVR